ncbi:delta endotoxin C-terminal domain-containing protein [Bacillus toyonensis]|uniref:delta endotoxin C-terminal domain-containing protein n=1 Tax=Bacillus toyonensis TaxID=155322 RepID=UPI00321AE25B
MEENVRSWKISHGLATSFWAKDSNEIPFAFPGNPETDCKLNPSEHKLSNVYLFGEYQTMPSSSPGSMTRKEYSSGVIYGFRQKDLHPKHIISPNLITQIPAEMTANNGMKNFQVIPEDITGQNVMKTRESSAYLLYDILALENTTYYGKIRLYLCFKGSLNHTRNMLIKQIEKDKNGHFGLTGSIPITLKEGRNQIKFVYDSNYNLNELFIDRVEIIPEKIEITIGSNGQITFTTYLDGRLEAKATNPGPLDPDGR